MQPAFSQAIAPPCAVALCALDRQNTQATPRVWLKEKRPPTHAQFVRRAAVGIAMIASSSG